MARYRLTDSAKADVREILEYIRKRSPKGAISVREALRKAMKLLADFPGMGHLREDLADERLRVWAVYSYLIIYRPEQKPLEIVRVVHGALDLRNFLLE